MFDFVGKRYVFFGFSLLIIIAGIVGLLVNGLNLDIQFQGGTIIEMRMNDDTFDEVEAGKMVAEMLNRNVTPQKSKTFNPDDPSKSFDILALNISKSDTALTGEEMKKVEQAIIEKYDLDAATAVASEINVEPFIGKEVRDNAIKALIILSILSVIYVALRFKAISGFSAGVFSVIALLHDVAIMFAAYTIFKIPVNELFIAAVLTIIGYSMNDKVVVYDRMRENNKLLKKMSYKELANKSIYETLSRSINTGICVLFSLIILLVFGKIYDINSLVDFSFPLIIGVISGCYSSIFIASPLWVMWQESKKNKKVSKKPVRA